VWAGSGNQTVSLDLHLANAGQSLFSQGNATLNVGNVVADNPAFPVVVNGLGNILISGTVTGNLTAGFSGQGGNYVLSATISVISATSRSTPARSCRLAAAPWATRSTTPWSTPAARCRSQTPSPTRRAGQS